MTSPGMSPNSPRFNEEDTLEWTPPSFLENKRCEWRRVCTGKTNECKQSDCFHEDGSYKEAPSHHVHDISWTFYLLCGIVLFGACVMIYFGGL